MYITNITKLSANVMKTIERLRNGCRHSSNITEYYKIM